MDVKAEIADLQRLVGEPERTAMRRRQGLPTPAARIIEVEMELARTRDALARAVRLLQTLTD